ncbi:MAG: pantetheine-phosphate adenylyltransferase [Clostridiales bacterium]|nr:pantetheine-phosphate adenylyltransferase [Clostridiales bacterium]
MEGRAVLKEKICVYPGSFDPITLGHLDIIQRAGNIFDQVIVAVAKNPSKNGGWMPVAKRKELIYSSCRHLKNISVDSFEGLLIDYMEEKKASVIIKGLRAVTDFESEFQMAQLNHQMKPTVETLFMMTSPQYAYISSSAVREIISFQGDVKELIPQVILEEVMNYRKNIT